MIFSTFLAGDIDDRANSVALNADGEIFVAGSTWSKGFPALAPTPFPPGVPEANRAFLVKLNSSGTTLLSTNVFSASSQNQFATIAALADGKVIAAGSAGSVYYGPGIPMFVTLQRDGSTTTDFDP